MPIGMDRCIALTYWRSFPICIEPPSGFGFGAGGNIIGMLCICSYVFWVRLLPKPFGNLQCIDFQIFPPGHFVTGLSLPGVTDCVPRDRLPRRKSGVKIHVRACQVLRSQTQNGQSLCWSRGEVARVQTKRSSGTFMATAIFFNAAVVPFLRPLSKSEIYPCPMSVLNER